MVVVVAAVAAVVVVVLLLLLPGKGISPRSWVGLGKLLSNGHAGFFVRPKRCISKQTGHAAVEFANPFGCSTYSTTTVQHVSARYCVRQAMQPRFGALTTS